MIHEENREIQRIVSPRRGRLFSNANPFIFPILLLIIVLIIRFYVFHPFIVFGISMQPSFETGDYVYASRLNYLVNEPQRQDVIILNHPSEETHLIKRVIGLPNENVLIDETGEVFISKDGKIFSPINERYAIPHMSGDRILIETNDDEYVVLGDHRRVSLDSRSWGVIEESDILGKVVWRILPVKRASISPGKV